MEEKLSGLYWESCQIGQVELEKIITMLLCFSDDIWLNANSWAKDPRSEASNKIQAKLEGLVEEGLVKLWSYPKDRQPPSPSTSLASRLSRSSIIELDHNVSSEMNEGVVEALHKYAKKMPRFVGSTHDERPEFEGIVEFVNLSSQLWSLSVANQLGASQILASSRSINGFESQLSKYQFYVSSVEPAFQQFLSSHFPAGLSALDLKDIIRLRKYSNSIRGFLSETLQEDPKELESSASTDVLARKIELEYMRLLEEELMKSQPQRITQLIAENTVMTIVGFVSPILQSLPWLLSLWRWQREIKKRRAPLYFMLELKKRIRQ